MDRFERASGALIGLARAETGTRGTMNGAAMRIAPVGIGVEITSSVPMTIAGAIHGRIEHCASGSLELRDRA